MSDGTDPGRRTEPDRNVFRREYSAVYSLKSLLKFQKEFLRFPASIGAIAPSSPALGGCILEPVKFGQSSTIVEFGPGTGAFTRLIGRRLSGDDRYLGIEINTRF